MRIFAFKKNNIMIKRSSSLLDEGEDSVKKVYNTSEMVSADFKINEVFQHPFNFYLIKNYGNLKNFSFLDKPSSFEIGLILDGFLSKMGLNFFFINFTNIFYVF